jgi:DNA invertase Pin-like site-specific DNA recombinase
MLVGYARVSTLDQNPAMQQEALRNATCEKVFTDTASGAKADRPQLAEALAYVRPGDTFVVWKLDWLGRSLPHLIQTVAALQERGIEFISLTESIDTGTPGGKLVFHIFGAIAEFERDLIRERTNAGLVAARARGRFGGGQRKMGPQHIAALQALYDATDTKGQPVHSIDDICETLKISRATLFRYVKRGCRQSAPIAS